MPIDKFHRRVFLGLSAAAIGTAFTRALEYDNRLPIANPESLRIDPARLQKAYDLLESWVKGPNAPVPGGAILVGRNGKTVAPRVFGKQGPEPDAEPLRQDAMFYLASITKPMIYMCGIILVERGLLNLSDKVSRYLPEFKGKNKDETQVLHLFTHTSGLADELPNNAELRKQHAPLSEFITNAMQSEAAFKPGTNQSYSSLATLLTAEIIQRLGKMSIREFVKKEILNPLGMSSTGLGSQGFDRKRLVRCTLPDYQSKGDFSWNSAYWQEFGSPAGGMFSTPQDLAVICALMLNQGKGQGRQILSPATIRMMTTNRMEDMPEMPEAVRRTQPWGLGWKLNHLGLSDSWSDLLGRQVFGHTGSSGNMVWMNPATGGFCILLTNYLRSRAPWRLVHLSNIIASAYLP